MMVRRNYLFKHQLANVLGASYERLIAILTQGEDDVEEVLLVRLCDVLKCDRGEILRPGESP